MSSIFCHKAFSVKKGYDDSDSLNDSQGSSKEQINIRASLKKIQNPLRLYYTVHNAKTSWNAKTISSKWNLISKENKV